MLVFYSEQLRPQSLSSFSPLEWERTGNVTCALLLSSGTKTNHESLFEKKNNCNIRQQQKWEPFCCYLVIDVRCFIYCTTFQALTLIRKWWWQQLRRRWWRFFLTAVRRRFSIHINVLGGTQHTLGLGFCWFPLHVKPHGCRSGYQSKDRKCYCDTNVPVLYSWVKINYSVLTTEHFV